MDMRIFREIGLTEGESKVYLALLCLGETKTGALTKEAKVSLSKIYRILDKLMEKGLAGYVLRGKVRHYSAMDPKRILEYIDNKKTELEEKTELIKKMIPRLEIERLHAPNKPQAVIYGGYKAVTNLFGTIIDELNRGDTYHVIGAGYGETPYIKEFFHAHHKKRIQKGIKLKMLANFDIKNCIVSAAKKNSELKFLPHYLITNMEIVFYKNKTFIVIWSKSPVGFLIEDEETMKSFSKYFEAFWKIAKK